MQNHRVSIRFSRLSDAELNNFTANVITRMTGNPAFPTPLVPLADLAVLQQKFAAAILASNNGGRLATVAKNQCRADLLNALRREASYVQGVARHDLIQLLSSGFAAVSQNRAQTQLPSPLIVKFLNEETTKLTLRLMPVANARSYQVQLKVGESEWQDAGVFPKARRIVVENLQPGTIYDLRTRAIGGSTGYSGWSRVTSRMSL